MNLYRPDWTCGRYHKTETNSYSLLYNLIEGMAYFFEDESANIIGAILNKKRNSLIKIETLIEFTNNQFSEDEIVDFCNELVSCGLLTDGILSPEIISNNRKIIGQQRKRNSLQVEKTIQERLPFHQDSAENAYMEILEKSNTPMSVMFELTYNCNEQCIHCFNPGAARNDLEISERTNRVELNLADYTRILDELKDLGVVKIILTGGDPFVKENIWELIELIYQRDFALGIYTNGLRLVNRVDQLAQYYPQSVGLSVYSAENEIHDSITRVKGSLFKTLKVADELVDFGIPIDFKCPIMKHNSTSYFTVADLAKTYGASAQFDVSLTDSLEGDTAISEQLQVDDELLEIILRDPNVPLYVGIEAPNFGSQVRDKTQVFCGAGINVLNVTPEGYLAPCNSYPTQFGNLRDNSVSFILKESRQLQIVKNAFIQDYEQCGTNERCGFCNRCPGQSFIEHGTPIKSSSANCRVSNIRMNLANKLKNGLDPLQGKSIEEKLKSFSIETISVNSIKTVKNYRNAEILVDKS